MASAYFPNVTQTPDILLDHWMAELSGAEFKVLMYLVRRTYGFRKKSDTVSLAQLTDGIRRRDGSVVDRGTGLSKSSVCAALSALEARSLILRERRETDERGQVATRYRLNLDAPQPPCPKIEQGAVQKSDRGVSENRTQQQTTSLEKQQTAATTAAADPAPLDDHTNQALVQKLREAGVSPNVATRLASQSPDECARQLSYLPFVENVRSTPGAYLRAAIEGQYAPPPGWTRAEKERLRRERTVRVSNARHEAEKTARHEADALLDAARADPERWAALEESARKTLPLLLRERPEHIAYQPALQSAILELLRKGTPC